MLQKAETASTYVVCRGGNTGNNQSQLAIIVVQQLSLQWDQVYLDSLIERCPGRKFSWQYLTSNTCDLPAIKIVGKTPYYRSQTGCNPTEQRQQGIC